MPGREAGRDCKASIYIMIVRKTFCVELLIHLSKDLPGFQICCRLRHADRGRRLRISIKVLEFSLKFA